MSTLKAETILSTLNTQLQALVPATVTTVNRNYPYSYNETTLPALQILMGRDVPVSPIPDLFTLMDWELQVFIDICIKTSTGASYTPLDTQLNAIRLAIHKNIMADYTLGLGNTVIINGYPDTVSEPEQRSTGEAPVSVMRTSWTFLYRTLLDDPSG